jgi:site-specific recombinase XerD
LPPAVVEALKLLRDEKVAPHPTRYVFADGQGELLPNYYIVDRWEKITAAKLPDVRWHDLRHASASFLIQGGASLAEVAHQLGHKNVATSKRYAHLVPGAKPIGADKLNEKLTGAGKR